MSESVVWRWRVAGTGISLGALSMMGVGPLSSRVIPHQLPATAPSAANATTFLGPNGVESRAIIAENQRAGTTSWRITKTSSHGFIDGLSDTTYATQGQRVGLYVSSSASSFTIDAFRMGYYHGDGARLVWHSGPIAARSQPKCPLVASTNTVSCDNWTRSLSVEISSSFVQGDYLLKLISADGSQSYVPLTVWDPTSHAAYFVKTTSSPGKPGTLTAVTTSTKVSVSARRPTPSATAPALSSYDRPYGYGQGAGDFLSEELPLVEFMEKRGLDVSYGTDLTVEQHPNVLENHRVLLSLGHDECWSLAEREAAVAATNKGMNIVFFGASPILRHVRLASSPLGPDREVVDYRDPSEDP